MRAISIGLAIMVCTCCFTEATNPKDKALARKFCPKNTIFYECPADPCDKVACPAYPKAVCKDLCNDCLGRFFDEHDNLLSADDCKCKGKEQPGNCLIDPCRYHICQLHADARCRQRACGRCAAEFVDSHGTVLTCEPEHK